MTHTRWQIQSLSPRPLQPLPLLYHHLGDHQFQLSQRRVFSSSTGISSTQQQLENGETQEGEAQRIRRSWAFLLTTRRNQSSSASSSSSSSTLSTRYPPTAVPGSVRASLPKEVFQISFSRSQGPGGQNVNKVNSKASVRLLLAQASSPTIFDSGRSIVPLPIPKEVVSKLVEKSTYYMHTNHSLLVSSESHRTQEANLNEAIQKLLDHLHQRAMADLVNPTSAEQKQKVGRLIAREKSKLKKVKSHRSAVKSGRRDRGF